MTVNEQLKTKERKMKRDYTLSQKQIDIENERIKEVEAHLSMYLYQALKRIKGHELDKEEMKLFYKLRRLYRVETYHSWTRKDKFYKADKLPQIVISWKKRDEWRICVETVPCGNIEYLDKKGYFERLINNEIFRQKFSRADEIFISHNSVDFMTTSKS